MKVFPELSDDKQLWVHIFKRSAKERSLLIPTELRNIEDVEARDIESWLRNDLLLAEGYRTPSKKLSIRRIHVRPGLRVTWLKLILGRWCMVAASDEEESRLSLWNVASGTADPRQMAHVYLDAPVINGQTDFSTGEVRVSVTVGAKYEYCTILRFSR